jgi:AbrB family looped-hinge helix DNA binding protein
MDFEIKLSSKGRITVPVTIRRLLVVKGGDRLRFVLNRGDILLQPVRTEENPFTKFIGVLHPQGQPDGTAVNWVRELRDRY